MKAASRSHWSASSSAVEDVVDVRVPEIRDQNVEVVQVPLQERMSEQFVKQFLNVLLPQIQEHIVEVRRVD